MNDILILTSVSVTVLMSGVAFYFWIESVELRQKVEHMKKLVDLPSTRKARQVLNAKHLEITRQLSRDQIRADSNIKRRTLNEMKEAFLKRLVDDGVIVVQEENMPSKPHIELRMRAVASADPGKAMQPSKPSQTIDELMNSVSRPAGTTGQTRH